MQKTIIETEENLLKAENEVYALKKVLSMSEDKTEPATLFELASLTEFKVSLHHFSTHTVDKKEIRRMIDATVNIVSSRVRQSHRIREQSLMLSLQDMQSQLVPLLFELERFKFIESLSNQTVFERIQELLKPFIGTRQVLTQIGMQRLTKISSKLRYKEKEKLRQKYQWTPNGDIEKFMEQDPNLFLAGIFYKEISTKQIHVDFDAFISQCLAEVGREDLKKFLEAKYFQNPQSARSFEESKQKTDASQRQSNYSQQQQQRRQAHHENPSQEQSHHQNQDTSILIKRMAQQMDVMYNMLQTRQQMFEHKLDDWKTPTFPFSSSLFQQNQSS